MNTFKKIIQILFVLVMGFILGVEIMIGFFKRHTPQMVLGTTSGSQKVETLIKAILA